MTQKISFEEEIQDSLNRLLAMIYQTNLVALDKTIAAVRRSPSYAAAAHRLNSMGGRIIKATYEIRQDLQFHNIDVNPINPIKSDKHLKIG